MCSHSGDHRILKTLALLLALAAVIAFAPSVGTAQRSDRKLTVQNIIDLLTGDVSSDEVAQEARKAGISFQVTPDVVRQIHGVGGTDDLIQVLRSLAPRGSNPPAPTPTPEPSTSPATLNVASNPGQTQVYIDGQFVGTTNQQGRLKIVQLAPGQHTVRITLAGYQDSEQTIIVEGGGTTTVAATLLRMEAPPVAPEPNPEPEPPAPAQVTQPGYLGVSPARQQPQGSRGVVLSAVQNGGPAARAGLKAYDTVLAVNGQPTTTPQDLRALLASHGAGEAVQITWYDGINTVTRQIRLAAAPGQSQVPDQPNPLPSLKQRKGMVTFAVAHDHGQSGRDYCAGSMSIGNGMVYYKGIRSTTGPGDVHTFQIPLDTIREARRNAVYLVAIGAFHIRTHHGTNYNFVVINTQGQYVAPDELLDAIDNARGK